MVRWTKRPQNCCRSCGYIWYPRGHDVSAVCPRCGSSKTETLFFGCLRVLFSPVIFVIELVILLIGLALKAASGLFKVATPVVVEQSKPIGEGLVTMATAALLTTGMAVRAISIWMISIKKDLSSHEEHEVSAVGLISKMILWIVLLVVLLVVMLKGMGIGRAK